jgi:nucleotide-binding universal stress UspA family protein
MALSPALVERWKRWAVSDKAKQKAAGAGVRCETIFNSTDQPYKAIVETAKKNNIDLIVMGTHGRNALSKLVMGSVTRQVIGHAPCAVLVVPA